eukprot:GHRR01011426.1.p1 GENE.GHRR01011426.1~~GHRR01011426.1.p1  ORF type:complete len:628 (+),score=243.39 GHRR01011426.1:210-2093(+)
MGVLLLYTLLALVTWPVAQFIWTRYQRWRKLYHLPAPPAASLLFGHAGTFLSTKSPLSLAEWTATYGSVYRIRFLYNWGVIVTDPGLVRAVLQNSKTYIPKNRAVYHAIEAGSRPPLPNIVSSSDGDYWRAVRDAWMKCFTSPNLKRVLPTIVDLCQQTVEQHKAATAANGSLSTKPAAAQVTMSAGTGSVIVNLCELTDRITLDVIGHVSYGRDFGAVNKKRDRYLFLVTSMLAVMHEEMSYPLIRLVRRIRPHKEQAIILAEYDAANTADVMQARQHPPPEHTIAGQLLGVCDPATSKPLTQDQLKAEMVVATLAGFETTSNALSWTLGSLACHPEAMSKLEQELDAHGLLATPNNPAPEPFTWQLLGKLPYLNAVIKEGLRLFSPAANGSFRINMEKDVELPGGLVIPKGVPVGVPFYALGHDPAIYGPDTAAFRPERWLAAANSSRSSSASSGNDAEGCSGSQNSSIDSLKEADTSGSDSNSNNSEHTARQLAPATAAIVAMVAAATTGRALQQDNLPMHPSTAAAGEAAASAADSSDEGSPAAKAAVKTVSANSVVKDLIAVSQQQQQQQPSNNSKQPLQDPWTFSIGPRDCAGQALARIELQVRMVSFAEASSFETWVCGS